MYFYKTITEQERWLTRLEVESDADRFRQITATEFMYGVTLTDSRNVGVK